MNVPRLRFPEFRGAGEWRNVSLGKICNVHQGYGFPVALQGKTNGKYPFCKVSDISRAVAENGGFLGEANNYIDEDELRQIRAKPVPIGCTVFAKIGEALRLNRRAITIVDCLIDNNAVGVSAKNGLTDNYFIFQLSQLIDLNKHCGGAVPSVNKSTLESIPVLIPEVTEQQKIADCLSSLDALIVAQADKIDTLKTHKKGLMQQLFPREGETVPRLRFAEFRGVGEWERKTIGDLKPFVTSGSRGWAAYYADKGSLFVRITNLTRESIYLDLNNSKFVMLPQEAKEGVRTQLEEGDVLISITADIGIVGYVDADVPSPAYINQHIALVRFDPPEVCSKYVSYLLASDGAQSLFRALTDSGTKAGMNLTMVQKIQVALPTLPEQQKIAYCLSSLDALIAAHTEKLDALKTHKKGLMQQLFPSPEAVA